MGMTGEKSIVQLSFKKQHSLSVGSPMHIRLKLSPKTSQQLDEVENKAKRTSNYRLLRRITALRMLVSGFSVSTIASLFRLAEQTIRNWFHLFLLFGCAALRYKKPSGRPSRLTKTQKRHLKQLILATPQEAGFAPACWTSLMVQEVIQREFGVIYSRFYLCERLRTLGFSYQKARFVSDHLNEEAREEWLSKR